MNITIYLNLICFLIFQFFEKVLTSKYCGYKPLKYNQVITGVTIDPPLIKTKTVRKPFSNIRIHVEYTTTFYSYSKSEILQKKIIEPAIKQLESIIKVKNPTNGIVKAGRSCIKDLHSKSHEGEYGCFIGCEEVTYCGTVIPDKFLKRCRVINATGSIYYTGKEGEGVPDVDIILLVLAHTCHELTAASAASCDLEANLDRPIFGYIALCIGRINAEEKILSDIAIIQHEIIHALGFSADRYAFYRYPDGTPRTSRDSNNLPNHGLNKKTGVYLWSDAVIKFLKRNRSSVQLSYTKNVFSIKLPTVLDVGRKHFNCSTLDGIDLEEDSLSHFSEYMLFNEMMTPQTNEALDVLSHFTFALLKDSGWYDFDFSTPNNYFYGKNKGCGLVLDGCYKYMQDQKAKNLPIFPFCDKVYYFGNVYKCDDKRKYYFYCYIIEHKNLDERYQYFQHLDGVSERSAKLSGGASKVNEFCPVIQIPSRPNSICNDENNKGHPDLNILTSYYGQDSLCFENGIVNDDGGEYYGASCQKYHFDRSKKILKVFFKKKTIKCPSNETFIIDGLDDTKATFRCPDLKSFENYTVHTTDKRGYISKEIGWKSKIIHLLILIFKINNIINII